MTQLIKRGLKTIAAIGVILLIVTIGFVTLIDPACFKGDIQKQIVFRTGRPLTIQGPLYWRMSPGLSLEINDLTLPNVPASGEPFLSIKKAYLTPNLWSLFSGHLSFDIQVHDLNIQLIRYATEDSNFKELQTRFIQSFSEENPSRFFSVNAILIHHATVNWQDSMTHQSLYLTHLTLKAEKLIRGLTGFPTPISMSCELTDAQHTQLGHLTFNAEWQLSHQHQQLDFHGIALKAEFQGLPLIALNGNLSIPNFKDFSTLQGKLTFPNIALADWGKVFNLPTQDLLLQTGNLVTTFEYEKNALKVSNFTLALNDHGLMEGAFIWNMQPQPNMLELDGKFSVKALKIGSTKLDSFKTDLQAKRGIWSFKPELRMAEGFHTADLKIDFNGFAPKFEFSAQGDHFEINDLLTLFQYKNTLHGRANAKTILVSQGNTREELLQNLSGKLEVSISDGQIGGIELTPLLLHAQSTIHSLSTALMKKQKIDFSSELTKELGVWKQQASVQHPLITPFSWGDIHLTFERGLAQLTTLKFSHPKYSLEGHGSYDLIQETMEYQALALLNSLPQGGTSNEMFDFFKRTPLTIQVKGPLNNLAVQPDLVGYTQGALKLVQRDPLDKTNDKGLEKLFGFP